jgi:hypothetical protein
MPHPDVPQGCSFLPLPPTARTASPTLVLPRGLVGRLSGVDGIRLPLGRLRGSAAEDRWLGGVGSWCDLVSELFTNSLCLADVRLGTIDATKMQGSQKERWLELAEKAAVEQDPVKLLELVKELNDLLEAKEGRLGIARPELLH